MLSPDRLLSERYRIQSVLGQGGMGAVYLATMDALGGKKVAVKEMELKGFSSEELAQAVLQFKKEASFLAHLDHPNLVQVTDFFVEADKHYLVMAYVTGETLQQKLKARGHAFDWEDVKIWAEPLVEVLKYLHEQTPPILFRDLKPSNVMIEDTGRLRLIDFGIARTAQAGDRTSTFLQGTGTSGFSPIEQYGGTQSTDERSDIYALGATLYYLLTGKIPPDAVARVSQGQELVPPSQINDSLPKKLDSLLAKALAVRQQDRHESMAIFREEMNAVGTSVLDTEKPTEDLTQGGEARSTRKEIPNTAATGSTPGIRIEMYPTTTAGQTKNSGMPWALGLAALSLCGVLILALASEYFPSAKTVGDKAETSTTRPVADDSKSKQSTSPKLENISSSESVPNQQGGVVEARPRDIIQIPKPARSISPERSEPQSVQPPPRPKPKSQVAKKKPSVGLGGSGDYPTAAKKPPSSKPAPAETVAPTSPAKQKIVEQRPTANTPTQPPARRLPEGFPEPPPGMPAPPIGPDGRPMRPGSFDPRTGQPFKDKRPPRRREGPDDRKSGIPGY